MKPTLKAELIATNAFHVRTAQLLLNYRVAFLALLTVRRQIYLLLGCAADD
jgi:hypothetical protein